MDNNDIEMHEMLCLSTAHLTKFAVDFLEDILVKRNYYHDTTTVVVYDKARHGYFMPVLHEVIEDDSVPESIRRCMREAQYRDADWIMFDNDGPISNELPHYDW